MKTLRASTCSNSWLQILPITFFAPLLQTFLLQPIFLAPFRHVIKKITRNFRDPLAHINASILLGTGDMFWTSSSRPSVCLLPSERSDRTRSTVKLSPALCTDVLVYPHISSEEKTTDTKSKCRRPCSSCHKANLDVCTTASHSPGEYGDTFRKSLVSVPHTATVLLRPIANNSVCTLAATSYKSSCWQTPSSCVIALSSLGTKVISISSFVPTRRKGILWVTLNHSINLHLWIK